MCACARVRMCVRVCVCARVRVRVCLYQTHELLKVCPHARAIYIDIGGVSGYDGQ